MSGTTEDLGRKIAGAQDLKAVVRSMKALAAASIGQYEKAVEALDGYYRAVELGLATCLKDERGPFAAGNGPGKGGIGAIVFGSDQGLVGRFNEVIVEFTARTLEGVPGRVTKLWAIGERVRELLTDARWPTPGVLSIPSSVMTIAPLVGEILVAVEAARERGEIREVYVFHNHPRSAAVYEPIVKRLLPLDFLWQRQLVALAWPTKNVPEVIGGAAIALEALLREYFFVLLFQACAQSLASENASRLAAMQRAEENITRILEELNRSFHRLRQESIDEELFEVIAGYESLSGHERRAPGRAP